jgi:N-acetylglucosaminyldiphosphoundecaprenol N-acetyl-beta-D-mannosaminyltransferase
MGDCIPDSISILGTRVSIFDTYDDAVQLIRHRISSRRPTFCVAINPEKVYRATRDPGLSRVLGSAHVRICDGIGISLASMLLYRRRLPRCTGIDLFLKLIHLSAEEGWKVFLLGASPHSNAAACRVLANTYPGLRIVGSQDGYFKNSSAVVEQINESGADLLFVAMGTPRQEFWISEQMPRLRTSFCMGVGGSLDVVGGSGKRAPALFRKAGMEWLFRLLVQPSRLQRQMVLPLFMVEILRVLIAARK